jgi:4-hydroxy-3-methylbut-2-enyl diphosphate reductase IspH
VTEDTAMKKLPYRAITGTGDTFDIEFPLNRDTGDAVRVHQLVSEILESIDRALSVGNPTSNGDVLQAVAMAMAVRARMIHAPAEATARLAQDLLSTALAAAAEAPRQAPTSGRA